MNYVKAIALGLCLTAIVAVNVSEPGPISLEENNMNIVRLAIFAYNDGDWASFADLYSPDYIQHRSGGQDPLALPDYELVCRVVHRGIPGLKLRIVDIFADNDKVAVRAIWEYRDNSYQFKQFYPKGIAQGSGIDIYRIKNSMIIEEWCESDPALIREFASIYKSIKPKK